MGINSFLIEEQDTSSTYDIVCPHCREVFECTEYEQVPGFRDMEDMYCPYCGKVVRSSMEYYFHTHRRRK